MNYAQLFANGGKTSDQDLIKSIQKILGIDDTQMEQLLQIGINKYGSLEGIGQALNEATQGLTQNSTPEEIQAAIASVFSTNAESQMFKCGGKLQQLVSKFGKGGGIDCGCGGIKLEPGGQAPKILKGSTPIRSAALAGLKTVRVPNVGPAKNRRVGAVRDNEGGLHLFEDAVVNGNSAQTAITIHPGDTVINQSVLRRSGWDPRKYVYGDDQYEAIMQRMRPFVNGVPYKQVGGELTRRQARQLATQNKGYNGAQFDLAMTNVKDALRANSDLRGRALRQRAREIVSGISDSSTPRQMDTLPTVEPINTPLVGTMYKDGLVGQRPTGSADQLSFADRFKLARGRGEQTFDWRGKSYGTSLAKNSESKEEVSGNSKEPTMLNEARIVAPTMMGEAKVYAPTQLPEVKVTAPPTMLNEARVVAPTMMEEARIVAPSIPNRWPYNNQYSVLPRESGWSMNAPIVQWNPEQLTGNEREIAEEYYGYQRPRATKQSTPISPVLRKCGGKVEKHQDSNGIIGDYYNYKQNSSEHIVTPTQELSLYTLPSRKVPERRDSLFIFSVGKDDMIGPKIVRKASRMYSDSTSPIDNRWWTTGNAEFNELRNVWEKYKSKSVEHK